MANMNEDRRFDWGPPIQTGDSLKEWLVYLVIVAVLGVGIWLLLDNRMKKPAKTINNKQSEIIVAMDDKVETVIPKAKEIKRSEEKPVQVPVKSENIQPVQPVQPVQAVPVVNTGFFVQIGAFSDEDSANEIYNLLKKENIDAKLLKPDEQFEIYRLVVGPYVSENEAEDKAEKLNEIGFPCFVVEAQ